MVLLLLTQNPLMLPMTRYQNVYGGRSTTDEEIAGLLIASLFAGQHTSSITASWTGLFMNANKVRGAAERGLGTMLEVDVEFPVASQGLSNGSPIYLPAL